MKVAVTGATGLLGWHLCCALRARGHDAVEIGRADLASHDALVAKTTAVDAIVHTAGASRGDDRDVADTNLRLAESVAAAVRALDAAPWVVFTNSVHVDRDTAYGQSKQHAADILGDAASSRFVDLVLPGVFGEHGRPFHNSVVSTFATQLAVGEPLSINDDAPLELLHAQDVADVTIDHIEAGNSGRHRIDGVATSVGELAATMTALSGRYDEGVIPHLTSPFDRALFNTLRSYRFPNRVAMPLEPRRDDRGDLTEIVKADTGGQVFISSTNPGVTRGNHFHRRKVERFVVVGGTARISLRRLGDTAVRHVDVSGTDPVAVDIPTLHTHNITNTGSETLTTLFWADEIFDHAHPDTFAEMV